MANNHTEKNNINEEEKDNLSQQEEQMRDIVDTGEGADESLNIEDKQSGDVYEQIKKELDDARDKYLRLVAEFENFRKRNAKERLEMAALAGRDVIQPLLEILDDSERAEKQMNTVDDIATLKEGVMLVFNKLRTTLQQRGLRKMDVVNQPFDTELHEAITEIPAPTEAQKGKVIDVIEPGYYLNDKIIRYAKVVVGK